MKALAELEALRALSGDDQAVLTSQRPIGIDEAGRIVLEYATPAAAAEAGGRAAMMRLGRVLREQRLAAGTDRRVTTPEHPKRRVRRWRAGPPGQDVLYLPSFLVNVTMPHGKKLGSRFARVNGDVRLTSLADEDPGLPFGVDPRLALMYLTTIAVLRRERTFPVGESANDFLALMGIGDTGGATSFDGCFARRSPTRTGTRSRSAGRACESPSASSALRGEGLRSRSRRTFSIWLVPGPYRSMRASWASSADPRSTSMPTLVAYPASGKTR